MSADSSKASRGDAEFNRRLNVALEKATTELLSHRNGRGFWEGELSSSALSTATAVTAFALASRHGAAFPKQVDVRSAIHAGLQWLATNQNGDGGWGDTVKSISNISTTTLCWAAFGAAEADEKFAETVGRAEGWLEERVQLGRGTLRSSTAALADAIIARYGKDRTFSVPILTMCVLAGRLGEGRPAWKRVIPLPFELAAFPHQLFAALRLPVVSYALPALIAIGQAHHVHAPSRNPIARFIRNVTREKTLGVLTTIQPENGGFLEATPLTSFVTMSLVASGQAHHIVASRGLKFLVDSQRSDGSWPIDTNLSTWCTTLSLEATGKLLPADPSPSQWILGQQYRTEHPYTHAAPGGWAWTDLPGGVPDADDTSGALVALARMSPESANSSATRKAAEAGINWLLGLQNSDGGIPTFCRGWGALPFDRSSADITAHAIRAWIAWYDAFANTPNTRSKMARGIVRALLFLEKAQRPDGSWLPLWFGNERGNDDENPTYGTARVLLALSAAQRWLQQTGELRWSEETRERAVEWFQMAQNADGSWGGGKGIPGSIEETALAVEALSGVPTKSADDAARRGALWLIERVESGSWREPSPIGFYFAKLWYFERLYPLIFTVGALRAQSDCIESAR